MKEGYAWPSNHFAVFMGAILLSSAVSAQQPGDDIGKAKNTSRYEKAESESTESSPEDFSEVDQNDDGALQWQEVWAAHGAALDMRGWNKGYVLDTFDRDHDARLDEEEHRTLIVSLNVADPDAAATALGAGTEAADSHINRSVPDVVQNPQEGANATLARDGGRGNNDSADESSAAPQTIYDLPIDDLLGRSVVNSNNQNVGTVDQVAANPRTNELGVVVRSGGLRGIGGTKVFVDADDLRAGPEQRLVWNTDKTEAEIEETASYQEENYISVGPEDYANLRMAEDELLSTAQREENSTP